MIGALLPGAAPWRQPVRPEVRVSPRAFSDMRAENFPQAGPVPWLDRPEAPRLIDEAEKQGRLTAAQIALCRKWVRDGYVILPRFFDAARLDKVWAAYEALIARSVVEVPASKPDDPWPERALDPHLKSRELAALQGDSAMVEIVSILLGAAALPFQTICSHKGSQQLAHSDSVHMTTYPAGYLAANWIAFEDIHPDSGPLEYYPGSHRLPYRLSREAGIGLYEGRAGYGAYHAKYEPLVARTIEDFGLKPSYFIAQKGDVLIWHANLLHGGSRRRDPAYSRRALVCHYFAKGCLCYHDYTAQLSRLHEEPRSRFFVPPLPHLAHRTAGKAVEGMKALGLRRPDWMKARAASRKTRAE